MEVGAVQVDGSRSLEKGEKERKGIAGSTESPALVC